MPITSTALTLEQLPPPPSDKVGWPWTEPIQPLPERMPDGSEWPRISIVTPSYNYGYFIEETIRSVLLQGYPNLEYIIIDGGSTDNTVEIIQKYAKYITYWVSEPDKGQTDAINKGYQHCTGNVFVWLNADDTYAVPSCLENVANLYRQGYQFIVGKFLPVDLDGNELPAYRQYGTSAPVNFSEHLQFWSCQHFPQPAVFVATDIARSCFPIDSSLQVFMDYQFFLRVLSQDPKSIWVDQIWVNFKYHGSNKSLGNCSSNFDSLSEASQVVKEEALHLPKLQRRIFQIELDDYMKLYPLIHHEYALSVSQVITTLLSRPTLARWPILWKLGAKALLGTTLYSALKKFLAYP